MHQEASIPTQVIHEWEIIKMLTDWSTEWLAARWPFCEAQKHLDETTRTVYQMTGKAASLSITSLPTSSYLLNGINVHCAMCTAIKQVFVAELWTKCCYCSLTVQNWNPHCTEGIKNRHQGLNTDKLLGIFKVLWDVTTWPWLRIYWSC